MSENLIHIGDVFKRSGSHKQVHLVIENEEFATSFARVIDEVTCDFTLESITNGIVVRGTIVGNYEAKCGYGLESFTESFTYNVNELFEHGNAITLGTRGGGSDLASKARRGTDPNIEDSEEEELYSFEGADIDVTQMVIDTILTNLPIAPVCSHGPENCTVCATEVLPYIDKDGLTLQPIEKNEKKIDKDIPQ